LLTRTKTSFEGDVAEAAVRAVDVGVRGHDRVARIRGDALPHPARRIEHVHVRAVAPGDDAPEDGIPGDAREGDLVRVTKSNAAVSAV
jgi:hypothetical protein